MRVLLCTDLMRHKDVVSFATQMNLWDESFAARYLRKQPLAGGECRKSIEPEQHYEDDKYDIYYMGVRDLEGLLQMCRMLDHCRIVTEVDQKFAIVGQPLYVNPKFISNTFFRAAGDVVLVPRNLRVRPDDFAPRVAQTCCPVPR